MTHGVTDETPDGMSLEKMDAIIEALRYERHQWLPARRTYISKKNGKKRPLGMPVWTDKLLQEVIRMLLETYYEPQFSDHSHGFRPERGCHTALREIYHQWIGTTWFIEGDISQCFDKLDHELLLSILSEQIHDGRFINLLRELFDAGYMEDWTYNQTLSGVPQGGVVSPVLANILLDKLDKFVETVLIPKYTKGDKRRVNLEYNRLILSSHRHRRRGDAVRAEEMKRQAQKLPSVDVNDPDYRRLKYVRYADDFLLGFIGPRSEAEEIKQELARFLQEELKLELSNAKTLITHARTEAAKFLGYEVTVLQQNVRRTARNTNGKGTRAKIRSINGNIGLRIPRNVLEEKCKRYMEGTKAIHRTNLIRETDYIIILTYQLEFRGIANYYRLAYNMQALHKLKYIMEISLMKTLAHKHKMSVSQIGEKYKAEQVVEGKKYKVLQVVIPRQDKPSLVATWGGIPLTWDIRATLDDQPSKMHNRGRSELVQRLLVNHCEYCGSAENIEIHHIRAMKDLHERPGREKPEWVKRMIALKRKTMVVCRTCHMDIQYGRPMTRQRIELAEVKALQKAKTTILESRVP
ncbi:MAG TPA: reverse transcriptase domain-containing protein [Ktedonobacteraceae bacterium]|nr:reverse transcriptase domain-containing protein [Ktedonobacteraceae bacterium]